MVNPDNPARKNKMVDLEDSELLQAVNTLEHRLSCHAVSGDPHWTVFALFVLVGFLLSVECIRMVY
jgi:hypothetical protein